MKKELKKWIDKVKENKATCYIKPTRRKHDSGFGVFEVGYCDTESGSKITNKLVLGENSDHIYNGFLGDSPRIEMELTVDGYIRIWGTDPIVWEDGLPFISSSARLTYLKAQPEQEDSSPVSE